MTQQMATDDLLHIPQVFKRPVGKPVTLPDVLDKRTTWIMPNLLEYKQRDEERAQREKKRVEYEAGVAERKQYRARAESKVVDALERGSDTFGKLREVTGMEDNILRAAIGRLLHKKRITKATRRTYTTTV